MLQFPNPPSTVAIRSTVSPKQISVSSASIDISGSSNTSMFITLDISSPHPSPLQSYKALYWNTPGDDKNPVPAVIVVRPLAVFAQVPPCGLLCH